MTNVDEAIKNSDQIICNLIDSIDADERGFLSQNILNALRNFVEAVSVKASGETEYSYDIFRDRAKHYVASRGNLKFLKNLHKSLQMSTSHYSRNQEESERLMLNYYRYLIQIKKFLKEEYNMDVLKNIDKFLIDTDETFKEYYEKIAEKINKSKTEKSNTEVFYIKKIKPFFIDQEIFYEVTFRVADDKLHKFDRFIAFTKIELIENYAVKLFINEDSINILGKELPIKIINEWEVSIRPCEFTNYEKLFDSNPKDYARNNKDYPEIMNFLKDKGLNLVEIIDFSDECFERFKEKISEKTKTHRILDLLEKSREFVKENKPGTNIIRYLLYNFNNRIIKKQYNRQNNSKLSNLNLSFKSIPFDKMPFASYPVEHVPKISNLYECLDFKDVEHQEFARHITINAEQKGLLYTPLKDIEQFTNINECIEKFNKLLYNGGRQKERKLAIYKEHVYITGYEDAVIEIIKEIKNFSTSGIQNYSNSINTWLNKSESIFDSDEKKEILKKMFAESNVALIYGAAGTGKTKLIEYISKYHNELSKLYLANTHSAVSNLRSRITARNTEFKTIKSFLSQHNANVDFDILIIDECSIVSNSDMRDILKKGSFEALVLVGDIFQIESINFGNWFYIAKDLMPNTSVAELKEPFRAKDNENLLNLWKKVRNLEEGREEYIVEHTIENNYSSTLNESIFEYANKDEIILCLNYDGFYGINNINRFLQENNKNIAIPWGFHIYKVDDPILFNESKRFTPVIHNNLKGKILAIEILETTSGKKIQFDIQIDKSISELDIRRFFDLELLDSKEEDKSVIRFSVDELKSTYNDYDNDNEEFASNSVPFQVAYAVSIHKAQGLEYNSVKIVIAKEVEERISHNIFYTAITRAKKELKIYWTPETQNKILKSLEKKFNKRDANLLRLRLGEQNNTD